jgi:acetoacetate decarboxylase
MTKQLTMPVHTPWFKGPVTYTDSEMVQVIFTPTIESYQRILPKPLTPGLLGGAYVANFKNSQFGDLWEAAIVVQCTYKEYFGVYAVIMFTDNETSSIAHREIWGFPSKLGKIKCSRKEDRIKASVQRGKDTLMKLDIKLEGPGDWIETGSTINLKLIPSVDGVGYDANQITAADLQTTVHEGLAGEGKLTLGNTEKDPLADLIQLENVVAGTWFKIDMHLPFGKVIGEAEL